MSFFYRFDDLHLVPGNKSAGFFFALEPQAFLELAGTPATPGFRERVLQGARDRILRAQLLSKRATQALAIGYHEDSVLARFFSVDPVFGGSLGCDPEAFSHLTREDAMQWLYPEVSYSPHNVDSPKPALALMLLVQTWCEAVANGLALSRIRAEEAALAGAKD